MEVLLAPLVYLFFVVIAGSFMFGLNLILTNMTALIRYSLLKNAVQKYLFDQLLITAMSEKDAWWFASRNTRRKNDRLMIIILDIFTFGLLLVNFVLAPFIASAILSGIYLSNLSYAESSEGCNMPKYINLNSFKIRNHIISLVIIQFIAASFCCLSIPRLDQFTFADPVVLLCGVIQSVILGSLVMKDNDMIEKDFRKNFDQITDEKFYTG